MWKSDRAVPARQNGRVNPIRCKPQVSCWNRVRSVNFRVLEVCVRFCSPNSSSELVSQSARFLFEQVGLFECGALAPLRAWVITAGSSSHWEVETSTRRQGFQDVPRAYRDPRRIVGRWEPVERSCMCWQDYAKSSPTESYWPGRFLDFCDRRSGSCWVCLASVRESQRTADTAFNQPNSHKRVFRPPILICRLTINWPKQRAYAWDPCRSKLGKHACFVTGVPDGWEVLVPALGVGLAWAEEGCVSAPSEYETRECKRNKHNTIPNV